MERDRERLAIEAQLGRRLRAHLPAPLTEFVMFGAKLAWSSLFAGLLLAAIIITRYLYPADAWLSRYDFLVIFAVTTQILMLAFRLESMSEFKVILLFHISGTVMEIFKLAQGSWDYPETGILEIGGVPLFSGFMYASVGSFMARAIRVLDMRFAPFPPPRFGFLLALAIYLNFFTHHWLPDLRWLLIALTILLFGRTMITFTPYRSDYRLPLVLSAFLSSLFLYLAENIGTLTQTWTYGGNAWGHFTDPMKITSWYLLLYVSFMQVIWIELRQNHARFALRR